MKDREFAVVRVRSASGHAGWAFTLTRDGAVAEQIRRTIAPTYRDTDPADRETTFRVAARRSLASHSAGTGLRALSIVDLATWDLAARIEDRSISDLLGGHRPPMPATAIVGYPPGEMDAEATGEQVRGLAADGWRRFKAPVAADSAVSAARLRAARAAAPASWIGCDAAWIYDDAEQAATFAASVSDVGLGWFEDVLPPGELDELVKLRSMVDVPIAMGDEQGGSYYPGALLRARAVDIVRIDLTCMGGITGGRRIVDECRRAAVPFAPHMFAHVHSQVFGAWGCTDCPIEWGVPGTGVDPYADSLRQPELDDHGRMRPLAEEPGFGDLLDREWALGQPHHDPDRILSTETDA